MGKEVERLRAGGALFEHHAHHCGNYLASLFDDHRVPDANILATNFIFVVQRRPGNGAAPQEDRIEFRDRGEHSGPAHLNRDLAKARRRLLGGVFPCARPFGRARIVAHPLSQPEIIELDDCAVRFESEPAADAVELVDRREDFLGRMAYFCPLVRALTERFQPVQDTFLRGRHRDLVAHLAKTEGHEFQRTPRNDAGVQKLEGTRCGVARVGERFVTRGAEFLPKTAKPKVVM